MLVFNDATQTTVHLVYVNLIFTRQESSRAAHADIKVVAQ